MLPQKFISYFLPQKLRNKLHPHYDEVCVILSGMIVATFLLFLLPLPLLYFSTLPAYFTIIGAAALITCFLIKVGIDFRIPTYLTFCLCFVVYVYICMRSGGIFSPYISAFYGILLTGSWAGKQFGYFTLAGCVLSFCTLAFMHLRIVENSSTTEVYSVMFFHCCLTIFMLVFFNMLRAQNEHARQQVRKEQHLRINELNLAIKERNQQLNNMRQSLAGDFHDETGNILSAIKQQALTLKDNSVYDDETLPLIDNIILNSERLYASSKDFLWGINHQSDDPVALFTYLTSFGQFFYNQFDIAFSVKRQDATNQSPGLLPLFAARHIIFIFKEAMNNVIKHSGANEVVFSMYKKPDEVIFNLRDDGQWKEPSKHEPHNGLANMKKRSKDCGFELNITTHKNGTDLKLTCSLYLPETGNVEHK